ncbi:MAG: VacJ family lipoprotein [Azospirillaceae bacterium]|nr:VacJ family lipoprotein [Azospirillaceae bacterium]
MTAMPNQGHSGRGVKGRFVTVLLCLAALAGCATPPTDPAARKAFEANNDPLEPTNREIFSVNLAVDDAVLKPVAKGYRDAVPGEVRLRIRNVLDNAKLPVVFANQVLEARIDASLRTFWRFTFNSTIGLGGALDAATDLGLPRLQGDFGETLYSWGIPAGPYLILPILGPSNPRDAVGMGVDSYADPLGIISANSGFSWLNYARAGVDGLDQRAEAIDALDELQRNSIDFYAQLRSIVRQRRAAQLGDTAPNGADFYDDPGAAAPAP